MSARLVTRYTVLPQLVWRVWDELLGEYVDRPDHLHTGSERDAQRFADSMEASR